MPHLTLTVFGKFEAALDGVPLTHFRSSRAQILLAYLALEQKRTHTRDSLAALLWPDEPEAAAKQNLRQALYQLRQMLDTPVLRVTRDAVQFDAQSAHTLDAAVFAANLAGGDLAAAVALYRDDLLLEPRLESEPYETWLTLHRERFKLQALDALESLAEAALEQGDMAVAERHARRQIELETWRENAHRQLMRALAGAGERAAALAQYETCRHQLRDALGIEPEPATQALAELIRSGREPVAAESKPRLPGVGVRRVDWGDAPDHHAIVGREQELGALKRMLVDERCRIVTLSGMGGIGKTTLAAHAARSLAAQFDGLIWRSLHNAPPLSDLLHTVLQTMAAASPAPQSEGLEAQLNALFANLRERRWLLVLDNAESIMQGGGRAGGYLPGFADYGQLFKRMGEIEHRSCLMLTSRELPQDLARLERERSHVRGFALDGLAPESGQAILSRQGLTASTLASNALVERYSGNPLALMLVGRTIQELFDGDIDTFLGEAAPIFDDIRDVLDRQFTRLTPLERDILLWVAVEREACSLRQLSDNLARPLARGELLDAVSSLRRRSLLHKASGPAGDGASGLALQNVVTEYLTGVIIQSAVDEIRSGKPALLQSHALLKARTKEYVRQSQSRLILQPVADQLVSEFGMAGAAERCRQMLETLRKDPKPGYAAGNLLNLLLHLGVDVAGYDFSRLSVWQAYLRGADLPNVNFSGADLSGTVFTDYAGSVMNADFSPDGKLLAAGADNGAIYFWDTASLRLMGVCTGHDGQVGTLAFSADGRLLVSGGNDATVRVWDVESRRLLRVFTGHTGGVPCVRFQPDGAAVISGGTDKTLRVWDVRDGRLVDTLRVHTAVVSALAFGPDGATLASCGFDQEPRLWDWRGQDRRVRATLHGHTGPVVAIAFCPRPILWKGASRMILASASHDQTLRIWDAETGESLASLTGHTAPVTSCAFSADGDMLMSGSDDQLVRVWDMTDPGRDSPVRILRGHFGVVNTLAPEPLATGATRLVSGSHDRTLRIWDARRGDTINTLRGHSKWLQAVAFAPDGQVLVGGSDGQTLRIWDGRTGRALRVFRGHTSLTEKLAFVDDGEYLASASWDKTARIWGVRGGGERQVLRGHTAAVVTAVIGHGPDGRALVATGGLDRNIRLWDADTGNSIACWAGHADRVAAFAFRRDGALLASASWDRSIVLWDLRKGERLRALLGHADPIECVAFQPGGNLVASGAWDGEVLVWNADTGELRGSLYGLTNGVEMVVFSPDGRLLAACACDHTICIWEAGADFRLRHKLSGHSGWVRCIAFSRDSGQLVSGGDDGVIKIWDVAGSGDCLQTVNMDDPYTGMDITEAAGLTDAQQIALRALGARSR